MSDWQHDEEPLYVARGVLFAAGIGAAVWILSVSLFAWAWGIL